MRSGFHVRSGFSRCHVPLKRADVGGRDFANRSMTQKRDNVTLDASFIDFERGRFFRSSSTRDDMPSVRRLKVLTTQPGHRKSPSVPMARLRGINALCNIGEGPPGQLPGLVGRQHAIAAKRQATAAAMGVAILNEKGLRAARLHPKAEAEKLVVPNDDFPAIPGGKLVYVWSGPLGADRAAISI
jgi:hypothetical protein